MRRLRLSIPAVILLSSLGCSRPDDAPTKPGDPKAVEALEEHWKALRRGDWRSAHDRLDPMLKAKIPLRQFTNFHTRRRKSAELPQAIEVVGSEALGDEVVVSFEALYAAPGGGTPVVVPPRRKVALRKAGDSWKLMTHDVLAVMP